MGQIEVFQFLRDEAALGRWGFVTTRDVERGLQERGFSNGMVKGVRGDLMRLTISGYLEGGPARALDEFPGRFRLKKKYLS